MIAFSEKLQAYIRKIENRTGRQTLFQVTNDLGLRGMLAAYLNHPTHIFVQIAPNLQGEQLEQSVAHEVTHGLLAYAEKYCQLTPRAELSEMDQKSIGLLGTMLEDIVVNKVIQDEGFSPFASPYLDEVRRETASAQQGKNHYAEFKDPVFRDRFMVFRYVMAWGYLKYFRLNNAARIPLVTFEREFGRAYPKQYKAAGQIKAIILQNDLFTAAGYGAALKKALELWHLDNLVDALPAAQ